MKALIFANGELNPPPQSLLRIADRDLIVAADGGLRNCLRMNMIPDVIIGDFDSLTPEEIAPMEAQGVAVVRHPARKDYTDLELALQYAIDSGSTDILVLGALGNRWDQTVANLLVAAAEAFQKTSVRLLDGSQEILMLRSGGELDLRGQPGDTVSLVPLCGDATGIRTRGLEYPLKNETLYFGSTRGVSNVLVETEANVALETGFLIVIHIHESAE